MHRNYRNDDVATMSCFHATVHLSGIGTVVETSSHFIGGVRLAACLWLGRGLPLPLLLVGPAVDGIRNDV